jgi:hypothetical protein
LRHGAFEMSSEIYSKWDGVDVGTFIFDQLDELTDILIELQAAVLKAEATEAAALALNLAERVAAYPHFSVRKPLDN